MEKSERLKQEAQQPERVLSIADCPAGVRPSLALATLRKMGGNAIKSANETMNNTEQIDSFLGKQAEKMKRMLTSGVDVDDSLVES